MLFFVLHFVLRALEVRIDFFRLLFHLVGDDAAVDALHDAVRSPSAPCDDILVLHADRMHDRRGIVTKLVEATNGYSLVEAENDIWYDIVRGYGLRRSLFR